MRLRSREVITPPVWNLPAPTTRRPMEISFWDRAFIWVLRPAWGYRLEALAVVVGLVWWEGLGDRFGEAGGALIALAWVAGALAHPVSRCGVLGFLHANRLRRRWLQAVRHAGL
ncbi:MAG: hypothetical protein ACRDJF_10880, partial [Actinomycetota bacterium]